jgi:hypothetical protein
MNAQEELKSLLTTMRICQGYQTIAKSAMVEIPIHKFPERVWEAIEELSSDVHRDLESQVNRILGPVKDNMHEKE